MTTNDAALAERLMALRVHGRTGKYFHQWIGVNSRLDALQAAVLRVKLRYLDGWSAGRQRNAGTLPRRNLAKLRVPVIPATPAAYQTRHVYNQFVIRCERRDGLQAHLKKQGIGSEVYYPLPLHLQPCYADLGLQARRLPGERETGGGIVGSADSFGAGRRRYRLRLRIDSGVLRIAQRSGNISSTRREVFLILGWFSRQHLSLIADGRSCPT